MDSPSNSEQTPSQRHIRLFVRYDGTAYSGWARQINAVSVCNVMEEKLSQITNSPCLLRAASRTDAGVHAEGQIVHFYTRSKLLPKALVRGINALLPRDIFVTEADEVPFDYDVRRMNRGKHYRYQIWNSSQYPPFEFRPFVYQLRQPLNLEAMARAAQKLVGTHDFGSFRAKSCERPHAIRTLFRCTITRNALYPSLIEIDVEGNSFLKNMVRIISGTLIYIGTEQLPETAIPELLAHPNRQNAGPTAAACGLCLKRVFL